MMRFILAAVLLTMYTSYQKLGTKEEHMHAYGCVMLRIPEEWALRFNIGGKPPA